jgi:hypothetical protein
MTAKAYWQMLKETAITALLFTAGKYAIGLYLGHSTLTSAFGAAGSVILILSWVYYSSLILLFGAEFTRVYARHQGSPLRPSRNAVRIPCQPGGRRRRAAAGGGASLTAGHRFGHFRCSCRKSNVPSPWIVCGPLKNSMVVRPPRPSRS